MPSSRSSTSSSDATQLKLYFETSYRPGSASYRVIATASGADLDQIAESFRIYRMGRRKTDKVDWSETDESLRERIRRRFEEIEKVGVR